MASESVPKRLQLKYAENTLTQERRRLGNQTRRRKQAARGTEQSARLNTVRVYARRQEGPGQAVFIEDSHTILLMFQYVSNSVQQLEHASHAGTKDRPYLGIISEKA